MYSRIIEKYDNCCKMTQSFRSWSFYCCLSRDVDEQYLGHTIEVSNSPLEPHIDELIEGYRQKMLQHAVFVKAQFLLSIITNFTIVKCLRLVPRQLMNICTKEMHFWEEWLVMRHGSTIIMQNLSIEWKKPSQFWQTGKNSNSKFSW